MERNRHLQGVIHLFYFPQTETNCCILRACSYPVRLCTLPTATVSKFGFFSSWGSALQPPYFPWTPVTFLTTHTNFCSSIDTVLPTIAPSWVPPVHCSAVWDIYQQQHLIQNILQGLGCHPFPPSHLIHSSCREDTGKCRSLNNKASHQCPLYFKRSLDFGQYFLYFITWILLFCGFLKLMIKSINLHKNIDLVCSKNHSFHPLNCCFRTFV